MVRSIHSRTISAATVLLFAVSASFSQNGGSSAPLADKDAKSIDILYTGRLLGYYRLPDKQSGAPPAAFDARHSWCYDVHDPLSQISAPAKPLSATLQKRYKDHANRILVGTGDNFALELAARVFDPPPAIMLHEGGPKISEYSKDQFIWDWKDNGHGAPVGWALVGKDSSGQKAITREGFQVVPTDNVACFLAYAGYDAIVPGRHDFYYGPERVRSLARLLASINAEGGAKKDDQRLSIFHPVQMLASNLLIKASWISGHSAIPDSQRSLLPFDVANSENRVKIAFPGDQAEVLPWLSRFDLRVKPALAERPHAITLIGPRVDPDREDLTDKVIGKTAAQLQLEDKENCWSFDNGERAAGKIPQLAQCASAREKAIATAAGKTGGLSCSLESARELGGDSKIECRLNPVQPLRPGYYKLCFWQGIPDDPKRSQEPPQCNRFTVVVPFLQYPDPLAGSEQYDHKQLDADGRRLLLPDYKTPKPYLIKRVCARGASGECTSKSLKVAIFGIVDPDLPQQVGEINGSWLTENDAARRPWYGTKPDPSRRNEDTSPIDKQHKMAIKTTDAAKALQQLMNYWQDCETVNRGNDVVFCYDDTGRKDEEDCKTPDAAGDKSCNDADYKILLAQMSPEKASQITAQLKQQYHFDVVITDHDPEHFTRDQITILDPTIDPGDHPDPAADCKARSKTEPGFCHVPSFVVVPPPAWAETWRPDPARLLRMTRFDDHRWEYRIIGAAPHAPGNARPESDSAALAAIPPAEHLPTTEALQVKQDTSKTCEGDLKSEKACIQLGSIAKTVLDRVMNASQNSALEKPGKAAEGGPENDPETKLEKATLATLLKETHADVAMLQKIDFWFQGPQARCLLEGRTLDPSRLPSNPCTDEPKPPDPDPRRLQKILDIILWKGDSFVVLPVRGSVLQAVMKRSGGYDSADESGLSPEDDLGRSLLTLGLQRKGSDYTINDLPLDPNRLYSVVTTDYIGAGDTAYPEFSDATVPSSPRPFFAQSFKYISSAVCERTLHADDWKDQQCSSGVNTADYFDSLALLNPKPPRGDTWQHQVWLWLPFHRGPGQNRRPTNPEQATAQGSSANVPAIGEAREPGAEEDRTPRPSATALETASAVSPSTHAAALFATPTSKKKEPTPEDWAQDYPRWKLSLDKGSLGFTVQNHSDSQSALNKSFGGVAASQALAPASHSWLTDFQLTFLRSYPAVDFVLTPELSYSGAFTEAKQGGFRNPNQSIDALTLDSGLRFHVFPAKRRSLWTIDTGIHLETQPFAIVQSLSLPSGSLPLQFDLPRTNLRMGRIGLGRYDRKSYLQIGAQAGGQFGAFKEFTFPGTSIPPCFPSATQTLQQCVTQRADGILTPNSPVAVVQEFRYRTGVFWHSLLVFPARQRISASLENQGEFFFVNAGDNSTDTRLQHLMTAKISFPIWPMISVSPTYRFYYYENKLAYKSLWQQQALITIDYKFDWTNKRIAQSQLEYKNAQSGQK